VSPFARFRTDPERWLCVHARRCLHEPLCERPCLSTPGVLGSGSGYVVPIPPRLLRPHPSVSPARGDFTGQPLIRRAFAVRERRGDPRDLPYFRCCAFHTCRRPYAGGAEAPTRCVRAPIPGSLVLSLSRPPQRPSLPAILDGVMQISALHRSRHAAARVFARPSWLATTMRQADALPLACSGPCHPRFSRDLSPGRVGGQARWSNGKPPIVGTCTQPVTAVSEAAG